jgi:hypothetical protein
MRSRVAYITDAPAGRVIGLRGVAQLMAQMNLVGGLRRFRTGSRAPQLSHYSADFFKPLFLLYCLSFLGGDRPMTQENIQIGAGVLAVILIVIIILRRKGKKKQEDEF